MKSTKVILVVLWLYGGAVMKFYKDHSARWWRSSGYCGLFGVWTLNWIGIFILFWAEPIEIKITGIIYFVLASCLGSAAGLNQLACGEKAEKESVRLSRESRYKYLGIYSLLSVFVFVLAGILGGVEFFGNKIVFVSYISSAVILTIIFVLVGVFCLIKLAKIKK